MEVSSTQLPFVSVVIEQDPARVARRQLLDTARAFLTGVSDDVEVLHVIKHGTRGVLDVALGLDGRALRTLISAHSEPAQVIEAAMDLCERLRLLGEAAPVCSETAAAERARAELKVVLEAFGADSAEARAARARLDQANALAQAVAERLAALQAA